MDVNDFVAEALKQEGKPYVWDAKGPDTFDCSGLVTWCLNAVSAGAINWRANHNANSIWHECQRTAMPQAGDFVLYGRDNYAHHIMIYMPDGRPYGATGGNQMTTTAAIAERLGAKVQYRSGVQYRADFLGYVVNPLRIAMCAGDTA